MQTEDMCPGTTDFKFAREKKGAFEGVEGNIITTGCGAPGAILNQCSPAFLSAFNSADIVISKGQGNYEALNDCRRPVFFLLKAKCTMIADRLSVNLNDYVFKYHRTELI